MGIPGTREADDDDDHTEDAVDTVEEPELGEEDKLLFVDLSGTPTTQC